MRFRLRTLLMVTTAAAFGLGVVVWTRRPSIHVRESVADMGRVHRDIRGKSEFEVSNRGSEAIKLERDYSVGPAVCEPSRVTIQPGEAQRFVVHWCTPDTPDGTTNVIARIRLQTSDPRRPSIDFVVIGRVE